jgi:hypothetical protein
MFSSMGGDVAFNWVWTPSRGKFGGILLGINNDTLIFWRKKLAIIYKGINK